MARFDVSGILSDACETCKCVKYQDVRSMWLQLVNIGSKKVRMVKVYMTTTEAEIEDGDVIIGILLYDKDGQTTIFHHIPPY